MTLPFTKAWRMKRDIAKDLDVIRRLDRILTVSPELRSQLRQTLCVRSYEDAKDAPRIVIPR